MVWVFRCFHKGKFPKQAPNHRAPNHWLRFFNTKKMIHRNQTVPFTAVWLLFGSGHLCLSRSLVSQKIIWIQTKLQLNHLTQVPHAFHLMDMFTIARLQHALSVNHTVSKIHWGCQIWVTNGCHSEKRTVSMWEGHVTDNPQKKIFRPVWSKI